MEHSNLIQLLVEKGGVVDYGKVQREIEKHGWFGFHIGSGDADKTEFEYTVGLTQRNLPELIVFGLPWPFGHQVLRCAIDEIGRREPSDGMRLDRVLQNYPVVLRALPDKPELRNSIACQTFSFYEDQVSTTWGWPRFMQLVWPDKTGRFPWQADCDLLSMLCQSRILPWWTQ